MKGDGQGVGELATGVKGRWLSVNRDRPPFSNDTWAHEVVQE